MNFGWNSGQNSHQNYSFRLVGRTLPDILVYADSQTYSGPDADSNFDQDDELVFMARHLGSYRAKQSQFIFNVSTLQTYLL